MDALLGLIETYNDGNKAVGFYYIRCLGQISRESLIKHRQLFEKCKTNAVFRIDMIEGRRFVFEMHWSRFDGA